MWTNPKYPELAQRSQSSPIQDDGQSLGTFPRGKGREELRVVLKSFEGHPYVSIRMWEQDQRGGWWPVKGKGISIRMSETEGVADALLRAVGMAEGVPRPAVKMPPRTNQGRSSEERREFRSGPQPERDQREFSEFDQGR